ncbi:hypothetical protein F6X40_35320 [Paraburkholderia sp. UCT31]|uniref:DUF5406 family protein n=1 Tax=Paraburkholderia sp. UCT31 TaxID=2615209 RepID=UPI0016550A98|nr:DUF5406 family protein [Paraburkholderia sp. UCT31]MBC8741821.1 hypothetical protein [Paraburkholderia sp. UCT31]
MTAFNYDPDLVQCGRTALQTVKLTFGVCCYRAERTVQVDGNLRGLCVIEEAVHQVCLGLPGELPNPLVLALTNAAGEQLECTDELGRGIRWLNELLIAAEIAAIEPSGRGAGRG